MEGCRHVEPLRRRPNCRELVVDGVGNAVADEAGVDEVGNIVVAHRIHLRMRCYIADVARRLAVGFDAGIAVDRHSWDHPGGDKRPEGHRMADQAVGIHHTDPVVDIHLHPKGDSTSLAEHQMVGSYWRSVGTLGKSLRWDS